MDRAHCDPVLLEDHSSGRAIQRVLRRSCRATLHRVVMVLLEIHRMFDSQVADVPGRGRTEVVMGVLVERMMRGQVPQKR